MQQDGTNRLSAALHKLPSLNLVRGFVAVGRRMSITRAAEDLYLTQSAVSRQVRALEATLDTKLLVRGHRSVAFTPEGERFFRVADAALGELQKVSASIRTGAASKQVTIASSIGFAGLWLLPRLGAFLRQHPNIDVRASAKNELSDLHSDELDLAIRYCAAEAAPAQAIRLFGETVAPVAHPSLHIPALHGPQDLEGQVLLEFDGEYRPWLRWNEWLAKLGWQAARPKAVLRFNQYDQTIHAAIAGQGIALGRIELISLALGDGRLARVAVPQPGPATTHAYWLIRTSSAPRPEVEAAASWIIEEARSVVV